MGSTDILGYPTLMDVASEYSSLDGGGTLLAAAQVLHRRCPLVKALPMIQSNQIISHIGARETSLGTAATRRFNEGVSITDTKAAPFAEPIALFEDYSEVDEELLNIQNNKAGFRAQRDARKMEGIAQGVETMAFYGNIAEDPGGFNGFFTRFNVSTSRPNGDTSWPYNVKLNGGSGSDTGSILFVEFGEGKVYGIYPQNILGGLKVEDLGKTTKEWGSNKYSQVYRTHLRWYLGLVVEDERCVQRIANVETSGSSNIFDPSYMVEMKNNLPGSGEVPGTAIFVPRAIKTQMDNAALDKSNGYFTQSQGGNIWGVGVTMFQGIPVFVAEKMLITETAIA
jgi:hypothetical protein